MTGAFKLSDLVFGPNFLHIDGYEVDYMKQDPETGQIELRANGGDDRWYFAEQDVPDLENGCFTAKSTHGDEHEFEALMVRPMTAEDLQR